MIILPEIVTIGIYDSRIIAKNTVISKNRKTTMFEIELPIEDGGVTYIDSNSGQIQPNMIICAKPGQVRHTKYPFKCYYIHMILHSGDLYDVLMDTPDFFEIDNVDAYQEIFAKLVKHYDAFADREEVMLQGLLLQLIYTIVKDCSQKTRFSGSASGGLIENALRYIKEHLTEDLTLEAVADAMSLSPIHFHNTFKRAVGKTLRDYVEEQRIKKAINLLVTTNYTSTKIAYECGFSSQSYFCYAFKRRLGQTPRQYAKEVYNKYEV